MVFSLLFHSWVTDTQRLLCAAHFTSLTSLPSASFKRDVSVGHHPTGYLRSATMAEKIASKAFRSDCIPSTFELDQSATRIAEMSIANQVQNVSVFKQREMRGELQPEPLLTEDKTRFVLFPIKHHDVSTLTL